MINVKSVCGSGSRDGDCMYIVDVDVVVIVIFNAAVTTIQR